ncbi:class I SAM-dependent methyltransferase [Streptomyces fragilis]|uniref:Class I SAM-dependent methyltransferase n=1 Tax=Streptomyces fragilis TaxID=67301 RepID=A0ABV2YCD4_9ACTN|nr:class I SAM-dependent methyltransferase [Streptomyces fragilis]
MELPTKEPKIGDAFGQILTQCWAAGAASWSAVEIIERDDGRIDAHDASTYFAEPERWAALEQWAWERAAAGRILDVGCGGGRHAVPWAARGLDVMGLDASAGTVKVMRDRGVENVVGSVPDMPPGLGEFDTVTLFGNNVGLLGSLRTAPRVLEALATVTRSGGRLIGTGTDPGGDDSVHAAYRAWNVGRGHSPGQARIRVRSADIATPWFDYWFPTSEEITEVITDSTCWALEELHRSPDGPGYAVVLLRRDHQTGAGQS